MDSCELLKQIEKAKADYERERKAYEMERNQLRAMELMNENGLPSQLIKCMKFESLDDVEKGISIVADYYNKAVEAKICGKDTKIVNNGKKFNEYSLPELNDLFNNDRQAYNELVNQEHKDNYR